MTSSKSAALGLILFISACGSPTRPSPASPAVPDTPAVTTKTIIYTGNYLMTSCGGCASWEGQFWRFTLTITQVGDTYSARMQTEPWNLDAALTGVRRPDGMLVFSGSAGPVSGNPLMLGAEFRDVIVREDAELGVAGTFTYTTLKPDGPGAVITATISSGSGGPAAPPMPSVSGAWSGSARHSGTCSSDFGTCDLTYSLLVVQEGQSYAAFWDFDAGPRIALVLTGSDAGGSIVLQGSAAGPDGIAPDRNVDVRRLALRVGSSGSLAGEYDYTVRQGSFTRNVTGVLLSGARRVIEVSPGPFHGEWKGDYVTRTCSGDCQSFRVSTSGLPLTLTQAGAVVQGQYASEFTLSGTASGTSLVLEGGDQTPNCVAKHGGPCTERLRIVITSIDQWGVMSGTVEYTWNGKFDLSVKTGELWRMARQVR